MKIKIGEYEVNISAKNVYSERANKKDTMALLNFLSICCSEAADHYLETGCHGLSRSANEYGDDIFEALKNAGCYDN